MYYIGVVEDGNNNVDHLKIKANTWDDASNILDLYAEKNNDAYKYGIDNWYVLDIDSLEEIQ